MAQVLLYNIRGEKLTKIRFLLLKLGVAPRIVQPEDYGKPLGQLLGREGFSSPAEDAPEDPAVPHEMLVMADLNPRQFNELLTGLRRSRIPVALKAVVTEHNIRWSSARLCREIAAEHAAMRNAAAAIHKPEKAGD